MHRGNTIIRDKGYYSYKNYQLGVSKYQIVPLIFPKSNFKLKQTLTSLSYPLESFQNSKLEKETKKLFPATKKRIQNKNGKLATF